MEGGKREKGERERATGREKGNGEGKREVECWEREREKQRERGGEPGQGVQKNDGETEKGGWSNQT